MKTQARIDWNFNQDNLLKISVQKSKKKNWKKIFYNLHGKDTKNIKARWMRWKHGKVKKRNWSLLEDLTIIYQMKFIRNDSYKNFSCNKRTTWQCFFRKMIFLAVKLFINKRSFRPKLNISNTSFTKFLSRNHNGCAPTTHEYLTIIKNTRLQVVLI